MGYEEMSQLILDLMMEYLVAYVIIVTVILVLQLIAWWKIFTKAQEAGWKAIIPFYNIYIMFKIAWKTKFFWIFIGLIFLSGVITGATGNVIFTYLFMIAGLVITIMLIYRLSKSFGKGVAFTIGIILLDPIFSLILAFGSARYIGPGGVAKGRREI